MQTVLSLHQVGYAQAEVIKTKFRYDTTCYQENGSNHDDSDDDDCEATITD